VTPLEMEAAVRTVGSNPYVRISLVGEGGSPLFRGGRRSLL